MAVYRFEWTKEANDLLTQLWSDGLSAGLIGAKFGLTRSAILGRVFRMGLTKRRDSPTPTRPRVPKWRKRPTYSPRQAWLAPVDFIGPMPSSDWCANPVDLVDIKTNQCRWVVGEPKDFKFCGDSTMDGCSYCERHRRVVYKPVSFRQAA